jgi:hypothetical protein
VLILNSQTISCLKDKIKAFWPILFGSSSSNSLQPQNALKPLFEVEYIGEDATVVSRSLCQVDVMSKMEQSEFPIRITFEIELKAFSNQMALNPIIFLNRDNFPPIFL